jgi:hypothetical protein
LGVQFPLETGVQEGFRRVIGESKGFWRFREGWGGLKSVGGVE